MVTCCTKKVSIWGIIAALVVADISPTYHAYIVVAPRPYARSFNSRSCALNTPQGGHRTRAGSWVMSMDTGSLPRDMDGYEETDGISSASSALPNQQMKGMPGDNYVKCGKCTACFPMGTEMLLKLGEGSMVSCSVCGHQWFQSLERILSLNKNYFFKDWTPEQREAGKLKAGSSDFSRGRKGEINIFVGNLPFVVEEKDLTAIFGNFGPVVNSVIIRDIDDRSRGYGFVNMDSRQDGMKAIKALNNIAIQGRNINVREGSRGKGPPGGPSGR